MNRDSNDPNDPDKKDTQLGINICLATAIGVLLTITYLFNLIP